MICQPCREPHEAGDCIDTVAGREYPFRHCACQHKQGVWVHQEALSPKTDSDQAPETSAATTTDTQGDRPPD
ncbi:hypothetical protein BKA23_3390 [Rudaeicoccus suwonensis]|uniref:Uncharacterized protein n=1 Tax=Rudaeicoccus suwonensis TaxID=657409 RepID=A0A561DVI7_9MICO|nr:hypothetical protein BKA23_3390 [Rudaeicoccus suwonensis]